MTDGLLKNSTIEGYNVEMDEGKEKDIPFSHFASLPIELFLHICSFLDVRDMVETLSRVCKRFNAILEDDNIWRAWVAKRWNGSYPVVQIDDEYFDWKGACLDLEKHWKTWRQKDSFDYISVNDVHISSTDAIIFLNSPSVCISGSRDRSMVVWSPLKQNGRRPLYVQKQVAHDGWIWGLHYIQDTLYSCSWDNTIKTWSADSGLLQNISTFRCTSPVLCMTSLDGLIIAGDFAKTVYAFDPRSKPEPQFTYSVHHRAVLTLGTFKNDIISGSEDKTLAVWDNRTRSIRQRVLLGRFCYPNCSYMDSGILYVGDNKGAIHIFNSQDGNANLVTSFETGHQKPISAIKHNRGYLFTSSLDGSIKVSVPTNPPCGISTVTSNGGEVGGMDYYDGILAVGSTELIEFWIPKQYSEAY